MYNFRKVGLLGKYAFEYAEEEEKKRKKKRKKKIDQAANGCLITLPANDRYEILCPVRALANAEVCVHGNGAISFVILIVLHWQGNKLFRCICGLPVTFYYSHSFRIGAATSTAMSGVHEVASNPWAGGQRTLIRYIIFVLPILSSRLKFIFAHTTLYYIDMWKTEWKNGWRKEGGMYELILKQI